MTSDDDCDRCVPGAGGERIDIRRFDQQTCEHVRRQIDDLKRWAYTTLANPYRHIRRLEIGQGLYEALKTTVPEAPPTPAYGSLLGVPFQVSEELDSMEWRTLDGFGAVLSSGSGLLGGDA